MKKKGLFPRGFTREETGKQLAGTYYINKRVGGKFIIITKCVNLLILKNATICYAKCDNCYYKVRQLVLQSAMTFKRCDRTQGSTFQNHNVFAIEGIHVEKGYTCNMSPLLFTLPIANTLKTANWCTVIFGKP